MRRLFFIKRALFILSITIISITILPGCKKIAETVFSGFDLPLNGIPAIIPPFPISYYPYSITNTYTFNLDSIVKAESNGVFVGKDLKSVKVTQATIHLQNADAVTKLGALYTVSIQLYSDSIRSSVTLARANVPDTATNTLNFDVSNSPEILPYLQGKTISYVISMLSRQRTLDSLFLFTDLTLRIE